MKIPYGRQSINEDDIQAVVSVLRSDFLTQGPLIGQFEQAFADYVGSHYAVAVSNGTAALHLAALALGVTSGTRVLTTPITFAASANCVAYCGGQIDFVDVHPETALIDLDKLEHRLRQSPPGTYQGVIPVDFAGLAVDLERLRGLADEFGLWILEDACHAPGGYFTDSQGQRQRCGNGQFADAAIFSFHPVKHIACGEGGMVTTNRQDVYEKLLMLRTHGITKEPARLQENHGPWYYEMQTLGYNYRLTDMQAALGLSQLKKAEAGLERRRQIADFYRRNLPRELTPLAVPTDGGHAYHLFVVRAERRKELFAYLHSRGVLVQVHYIPVHRLPYYQHLGFRSGDFPVAESYYEQCLSLPMYPGLEQEQLDYILAALRETL